MKWMTGLKVSIWETEFAWSCWEENLAEERINDKSQSEDFSQLQERSGNLIKIKVAFDWQKGLLYYWGDYFK